MQSPPGFQEEAPAPGVYQPGEVFLPMGGLHLAPPADAVPRDDEASSVHNVSRDDVSVDSQGSNPSRRKPYSMLGERVADLGYRPFTRPGEALWTPMERPESAPLPERGVSNLALLVSSLQELTTVVARQGDEIRELRDEARNFAHREALQDAYAALNLASRDDANRTTDALHRVESRLANLDRRLQKLEEPNSAFRRDVGPPNKPRRRDDQDNTPDAATPPYAWPSSLLAGDYADAFAASPVLPSRSSNDDAPAFDPFRSPQR